ncbi:MAG: hypothetical protein ACOVT5_17995, partial [Armatimonadaceae bacterium]
SDRLLGTALHVENGTLLAAMGRWSKLMVPRATAIRPSTILAVDRLLRAGAVVECVDELPDLDVESTDPEESTRSAAGVLETWRKLLKPAGDRIRAAKIGNGNLRVGPLNTLLRLAGNAMGSHDSSGARVRVFTQRRADHGTLSAFVVNADNRSTETIRIRSTAPRRFRTAMVWDPMNDSRHRVAVRRVDSRTFDISCVLQPGESRWICLGDQAMQFTDVMEPIPGAGMALNGPFQLEATGGPAPWPAAVRSTSPGNWCTHARGWADFSGTARYRCTVELPENAAAWELDLGDVRHSVRVRVDGREVGGLIAPPYRLELPEGLPGRFVLELDVTNLDANRLAAMDRARVPWKPFFLVNSDYQPFDASGWLPLESGLLGPVVLRPLRPSGHVPGRKRPTV